LIGIKLIYICRKTRVIVKICLFYIFTDILSAIIIILFITFIFGIKKEQFYKLKRNFEFAISLPGKSIFATFVDSLQIAYNHKGE